MCVCCCCCCCCCCSLWQLLKQLNSNTENPYLIWDNRTRAELTKYLEEQQQAMVRTVSHSQTVPFFFHLICRFSNSVQRVLLSLLSIFTQHKRYHNNKIKNKNVLPACQFSQTRTLNIESMLLNRIRKVNHILCWLMTMILYTIYISTVNLSLSHSSLPHMCKMQKASPLACWTSLALVRSPGVPDEDDLL